MIFLSQTLYLVFLLKRQNLSHIHKLQIPKKYTPLPLYIYPPLWLDATLKPKHFESCHPSSQDAKHTNMVNECATF